MSFELPIQRRLKLLRGDDPGVPKWYAEWEAEVERLKLEVEEGLREALQHTLGEPRLVNRIPERIELQVMPADDEQQRRIGWYVRETIGVGVYNSSGLSNLLITDE